MRPLPSLLLPALVLSLQAQPATPLSPAQRQEVLTSLTQQLKTKYVFPEVAERVAKALQAKADQGGFDGASTMENFAATLTKDLQSLSKDKHFKVRFVPGFKPDADDEDRAPTPAEVAEAKVEAAQRGFGIARVERLPGNVGYLDIRGFEPTELVAPAYTAALSLLSGTDGLILDLRKNGGGSPESVAYLMSHFFGEGDVREINAIYNRIKDTTRQYWTVPVPVRYTKPVYVLISPRTFSGGEECAYDFQTQKRGTLVGEPTGGGANPGGRFPLVHGLACFIPTGRAINPITKTNWEGVGVKPDVAAPAAEAHRTAHLALLRDFLKTEKDPRRVKALEEVVADMEKQKP